MKSSFFILLLLKTFLLSGCDIYEQDSYQQEYVVESYLVAERDLPLLRLSTTAPIEEQYVFEEYAVNNADVEVILLDQNGNTSQAYTYRQTGNGIYEAENPEPVQPQATYRLEVRFPDSDHEITAETLVPGDFETVEEVVDSIPYQSDEQITITTSLSHYPGRQAYFIFSVNALDPATAPLTPFYKDLVEDEDSERNDFAVNSSGIINQENYEVSEDSTITLRLPWLSVAFYGENDIVANALDDNMYDFYRSQDVQTGGSTLPPGEIQNIIYNVEGGIGIFGSLASDTNRVFIENPFGESGS